MDESATHFQNEYVGQTTVHPVGFAVLIVLGLATILLPRRWAVLPSLVLICFVPMAQRVVLGGLDFTFLRIMVLFGWARVLLMGEYRRFAWSWLDGALLLWAAANLLLGTRTSGGDGAALVKYLGSTYDAVGTYFLCRCLIRDWRDLALIARAFIVISVPVALAFLWEFRTGRNLFSMFGGVPEMTNIRDGRLRCQGAFSHPILAGCFWASLLPLMAAQAWRGWRAGALVGFACGIAIVGLCASSTPLFAVVGGAIATVVAFFKPQTRKWIVRFAAVGAVALHLVMNAPVWHLLTRVSIVGGSSGRHRFRLIDAALEHANEWWMAGSTLGTDHWGRGLFDVTNYYLAQCLRGGLPLLLLFGVLLWAGFGAAARARQRIRGDFGHVLIAAALSVSLFQHAASFIGVTYFGQIVVLWYMLLAMVGSIDVHTAAEARTAAADGHDDVADPERDAVENRDPLDRDRDDRRDGGPLLDDEDVVLDWPRRQKAAAQPEVPCIA